MPHGGIEDFLAVRWYDGLLVRSEHLSHSDRRVAALFSQVAKVALDQPGVAYVEADSSIGSQLVEITSSGYTEDRQGVEIVLDVTRPFRGITAEGGLLLGIPTKRGVPGVPLAAPRALIAQAPGSPTEYLVCARQELDERLSLRKQGAPGAQGQPIELAYPALRVEMVAPEQYRTRLFQDLGDSIPIAAVKAEGDKAEVDTTFIPPVTSLRVAGAFNVDLVATLARALQELCQMSTEYLAAGGHVLSRGDTSVELRTRYNFYLVLNAILLAKAGLLRNLEDLSPLRLLGDVIYPLSQWFDRYYEGVKERRTPLTNLSGISSKIGKFSQADVLTRTDGLVKTCLEFVSGVSDSIREVA